MKRTAAALIFASVLIAFFACAAVKKTIAGFEPYGERNVYNAANLSDVIDGAAELYLDYGFRELTIQALKKGDLRLSVETYDLGLPINAFGIFRRERPSEGISLPVGGQAAAVPPYSCILEKGEHFVRVMALEGSLTKELCQKLLADLEKTLPGENRMPEALDRLPSIGRVAGSEGYTRKSYLGVAELESCLHAEYGDDGGKAYKLFAVIEDQGETAEMIWQRFAAKWKPAEIGSKPALIRDVPYTGEVALVKTPRGIFGIAGARDFKTASAILDRLAPSRSN